MLNLRITYSEFNLVLNRKYHKTPEETMTHDSLFQLPTSQAFLAIGSFESGFLGNPNGALQTCNHCHPRHKYLEWFPQEYDPPIFWVILDLQARWDFLLPGQSIQLSLSTPILLPLFQSSSFQVGEWNRHGSIFLKSSWVQVRILLWSSPQTRWRQNKTNLEFHQ